MHNFVWLGIGISCTKVLCIIFRLDILILKVYATYEIYYKVYKLSKLFTSFVSVIT